MAVCHGLLFHFISLTYILIIDPIIYNYPPFIISVNRQLTDLPFPHRDSKMNRFNIWGLYHTTRTHEFVVCIEIVYHVNVFLSIKSGTFNESSHLSKVFSFDINTQFISIVYTYIQLLREKTLTVVFDSNVDRWFLTLYCLPMALCTIKHIHECYGQRLNKSFTHSRFVFLTGSTIVPRVRHVRGTEMTKNLTMIFLKFQSNKKLPSCYNI